MSRNLFVHLFLQSWFSLTHKPKIFKSVFNKKLFHLPTAPNHFVYKTSGYVSCNMASSMVRSNASFSTLSIPTNEPVGTVDWLHANFREHDMKMLGGSEALILANEPKKRFDQVANATPTSTATTLAQNETLEEKVEAGGVGHLPNDSTDVFRKWGCSDDDILKIFIRQPSLRHVSLTKLQSKLNILRELGLNSSDLVKIINCRPRFLSCCINQCLDERLEYLQALFGSREMLIRAIIRNPSLLTYDFHNRIKPVIAIYNRMGISRRDLIPMLLSRPTLIPRTSLNDEKMVYIRKTGISKESKMYKYVVTLIAISRLETIREKVSNFEKFGFSDDEILGLFGRSPLVLTLSIDKVQRNMTFVLGTMKLPASVILDHPFLLFFNLEAVLKPRVLLAGKIQDLGLVPQIKGPAMLTAVRMKEKRFIEAFVKCHPEDVANELMDFYTNAKGVKRLGESSKKSLHKGFPF